VSKHKPDYSNLRIAHGKDRCANLPQSGPQGGGAMRRLALGNGFDRPRILGQSGTIPLAMDSASAGIEIEHVGEVGSELVESPTEA
jgi:hypothetical protein